MKATNISSLFQVCVVMKVNVTTWSKKQQIVGH